MIDIIGAHPWRQAIAAEINTDIAIEIADDDPDWEYLDGEMVKLGSLEHQLLNINDIQQRAITLLSHKTKDMRVLAHLLRTLQHQGDTQTLLLAITLLTDYVRQFWQPAAPISPLKKSRLTLQILKRFEPTLDNFNQHASRYEREAMQAHLEWLAAHLSEATLVELLTRYRQRLQAVPDRVVEQDTSKPADNALATTIPSAQNAEQPIETNVKVDDSNEKAWRYTLLKVAEILVTKHIGSPIGYQLRRHTIWSGIDTLPPVENKITPLAAVSADMRQHYLAHLTQPTYAIWGELEYSLTLAPFWLEGHFISATYAEKLGFTAVASAIQAETRAFLMRLPELKDYHFNDGLPFLSEDAKHWLFKTEQTDTTLSTGTHTDFNDVWACYERDGLTAAFALLNQQPAQDGREKFYAQLTACQLMEKAEMTVLAQQGYQTLQNTLSITPLAQWEDRLFAFLAQKVSPNTSPL
ncbi:type VI secretion system protein TssA [Muribacter muris]|uniref:Type VI secretion system protein TssA n=1 Tax=Muribacter muris TaxID=67855 RepID=A0A4Y9JTF6_9PAST|nr:type VI secretion system protein TssA [Muribacter muris]MBF0785579.1 type VI secretion system protein TssA [Muribacter muris]MBF0827995.1 type VI secretion system protein TssA [Muribacter muris]TFV09074.1 type VI secretion system protein TssA [Muribacter muris]